MSSVRAVRSLTRSRRGRPWLDWYAAGFMIVLVGIYLANFLSAPLRRLTTLGDRASLPVGQAEAALALVIAAGAGLLLLAQALGPLTLSPADASWLLLTPVHRRGILRRPFLAVTSLGALAGGILGALALAMAGPYIRQVTSHDLGPWLVLAVLAGAGLGVATVLATLLAQPYPERPRRVLHFVFLVSGGTVVIAAVAGEHWSGLPKAVISWLAGISRGTGGVVTIVVLVAALLLVLLAWVRLRDFPARVLWEDSARAGRARLAAAFLNVQLLTWIAEDNHWRRRLVVSRPWPSFSSTAGPALGPALLLAWADWRRLGRRWGTVVAMAFSAVAPALVTGALTGPDRGYIAAAVLLLGGIMVAGQGTLALRRDTNDKALRRLLGVGERQALAARAILPSALASAWLGLALVFLASAGELHGWWWPLLGLLAGPGAAVAALRNARTAPIDAADIRAVDAGMGSVPNWMITRVLSVVLGLIGTLPLLSAVLTTLRKGTALHPATLVLQVLLSAVVLGGYLLASSS